MRKRMVFFLPLVVVVACAAPSGDVNSAQEDAKDRGFTVLATRNGDEPFADPWIDMKVSFGEGGCTGDLSSDGDGVRLSIDLPVPGSSTETTSTTVDDPKVETLRSNPAFKNCFEPKGKQSDR